MFSLYVCLKIEKNIKKIGGQIIVVNSFICRNAFETWFCFYGGAIFFPNCIRLIAFVTALIVLFGQILKRNCFLR